MASNYYGTTNTLISFSSVSTIPVYHQSYSPLTNEDYSKINLSYTDTDIDIKTSNNIKFKVNSAQNNIASFVNKYISNPEISNIYKYADDPDFIYVSLFDQSKSIEDNFSDVSLLTEHASEQNLNYVFVVG